MKDSQNNDMERAPFSGSTIRVQYAPRVFVMQSLKKIGVRLDFAGVQVLKLAESGGGVGNFGTVEDGYVTSPKAAAAPGGTSEQVAEGEDY